jgi:hypothetical protein
MGMKQGANETFYYRANSGMIAAQRRERAVPPQRESLLVFTTLIVEPSWSFSSAVAAPTRTAKGASSGTVSRQRGIQASPGAPHQFPQLSGLEPRG